MPHAPRTLKFLALAVSVATGVTLAVSLTGRALGVLLGLFFWSFLGCFVAFAVLLGPSKIAISPIRNLGSIALAGFLISAAPTYAIRLLIEGICTGKECALIESGFLIGLSGVPVTLFVVAILGGLSYVLVLMLYPESTSPSSDSGTKPDGEQSTAPAPSAQVAVSTGVELK